MLNSPAASAAPVPPAHTSACAGPSAIARAACTIDACGVRRAALAGSAALAIEIEASTTSIPGTPCAASFSSEAGPKSITRAPSPAAISAPAATSAGPRSAPLQSTATTGARRSSSAPRGHGEPGAAMRRLVLVAGVVLAERRRGRHLAPCIEAALRAHAVRPAGAVALRALVERRRRDPVLRAALCGAAVRLLFLGDGHPAAKATSRPRLFQAQLAQLGPARVGRALVAVTGAGLVEVGRADRAQPGAVGAAEHLHGRPQREGVVRPGGEVEQLV